MSNQNGAKKHLSRVASPQSKENVPVPALNLVTDEARPRIPFYPNQDDLANLDTARRLAGDANNNNQVLRNALKWYVWLLEQKEKGAAVQVVRENRAYELLVL